ncbi:MAG: acyl-CoA dehydrogenase [Hydrocarboniphaga sp.]|uniref:acyl-CoA dehydrogenase family protein n=1 Tax=Hydrocarboniphaga sp. TaxID=2033016 RepID=UPI00260AE5AA|nr:acyl-CoA dehydrogenase family protein [Hydrocarboniphaga sp.]MDB5970019.1 acyl-CoA dehydrogenase [Hydrocarboniphaga sp.]
MNLLESQIAFPDEIQAIKTATADWITKRVLPREVAIYTTGEVPADILQEMRDLGYFGLTIAPEYGGSGLSHLGFLAVHEELTRGPKPLWNPINVANGVAARVLQLSATEEQKQKYLPGIAAGTLQPAIAVTEPQAGSDVQGLKSRAEKTGKGWVINGSKHYITFGARADVLFVLARTAGKEAGSAGFTLFLVDKGNPGLKIARMQENMSGKPLEQTELLFDNCEVLDSAILGGVGKGLKCVFPTFAEERVTMATTALGTARRAIELAVDYAKTRKTFGSFLSEYQALQHSLADCVIELTAARSMTFELARQLDHRVVSPPEAAMVKVFCAEMANRVVDRCLQVFGGAGFMAESPICQMYRDVRVLRISGGTSEIQRNIIAKELLK